ncbi:uncharacterized protein LOC130142143 [Falco biarmicus]|uniref:uncharacterized protein LOC130142143 n=1 Tax=Falco biarmicus TaxID=345155 RepID=UPI0024BCC0CC|nr:uncharacterized protein LOC130142143 [Falco biarmicus]
MGVLYRVSKSNRFTYLGRIENWGVPYRCIRGYQLPPGVFLICGDRAWPGIPLYPVGGPCYLGHLTFFAPRMKDLLKMTQQSHRSRRALRTFDETCNDRVDLQSLTANVLASIFIPGAMTALYAKNMRRLACWGEKQFNLTSKILSSLLLDVDNVRHDTLQNRAAIDFLLLAHGHGCEDFEGMCCMNLSDHSISMHKKLSQLNGKMKHILADDNPFDELLRGFGITGWLKTLLMEGIRFVIIIVAMFLVFSCLFSCVKKGLTSIVNQTWVVQKEKRGYVEGFLKARGHMLPLSGLDKPDLLVEAAV